MRIWKHAIVVGAFAFAIVVPLKLGLAATVRDVCDASCQSTKASCNNSILTETSGKPTGCSKVGTNGCTGDCYRCNSGASDDFCERDKGSQCLAPTCGPFNVSCGQRIKFTGGCGGTWSANCTCPSTGGTTTETACEPSTCVG